MTHYPPFAALSPNHVEHRATLAGSLGFPFGCIQEQMGVLLFADRKTQNRNI